NGYHGDTFGAMAVCDPVNGMHGMFRSVLAQHIFVDAPDCREDELWQASSIASLEAALRKHHQHLAAVIIEPIVQGAGGMRIYCAEY
ncbi:PREDICTED: adenosylmethionine-8-amino-7-oxononanoate aminotransferase-like, partial [Priapulus caudatus]|uniref:Adenosylmethionine-8-amino-7-oxononanoate aminotransferase-like n=1 Tax=Priapulus caudatus TaxID=37621 RepID=A0ABM1F864_PRICU